MVVKIKKPQFAAFYANQTNVNERLLPSKPYFNGVFRRKDDLQLGYAPF